MEAAQEFPTARSSSAMFVYEKQLMLWGGITQFILGEGDERFVVNIDLPNADLEEAELEIFDLETYQWGRQVTTGDVPYVGQGFSFALSGDSLFLHGGVTIESYFKDLYELSLRSFVWRKRTSDHGPSPIINAGMVACDDSIFVFGGSGPKPRNSQKGAVFVIDDSFKGIFQTGWNNYIHEFGTQNRTWRELESTGERPPPIHQFSLTKIDPQRALMFGGKQKKYSMPCFDTVYIWNLQAMHWDGPYRPTSPDQKWPAARGIHSAACLVDPNSDVARTEQKVIVFWGSGLEAKHVRDIWILNVMEMTWQELKIELRPRMIHMSCSYHIQERQTDVFVYGGNKQRKSKYERHVMTSMIIFRFGSVRRLDEMCELLINKHWKLYEESLTALPRRLRDKLTSLHNRNEEDYQIIYPNEADFD